MRKKLQHIMRLDAETLLENEVNHIIIKRSPSEESIQTKRDPMDKIGLLKDSFVQISNYGANYKAHIQNLPRCEMVGEVEHSAGEDNNKCTKHLKDNKFYNISNACAAVPGTFQILILLLWCTLFVAPTAGTQQPEEFSSSTPIPDHNPNMDSEIYNCSFTFGKIPRTDTRFECDNLISINNQNRTCHVNISVGITKYPENMALPEVITFLQGKTKNLRNSPASIKMIWKYAEVEEVTLNVSPRTKKIFYQIIGVCGSRFEIRTSDKHFEVFNAPSPHHPTDDLDSLEWKYFEKGGFPISSGENGFQIYPSLQNKDSYPYLTELGDNYDCDESESDCNSDENAQESKPRLESTRRSVALNNGMRLFSVPGFLIAVFIKIVMLM